MKSYKAIGVICILISMIVQLTGICFADDDYIDESTGFTYRLASESDAVYATDPNSIIVTGYSKELKNGQDLTVPSEIDGKTVAGIEGSFGMPEEEYGTFSLPDTLKQIQGCLSLRGFTGTLCIPESVISSENCRLYAPAIEELILNASVEEFSIDFMDTYSFLCEELRSLQDRKTEADNAVTQARHDLTELPNKKNAYLESRRYYYINSGYSYNDAMTLAQRDWEWYYSKQQSLLQTAIETNTALSIELSAQITIKESEIIALEINKSSLRRVVLGDSIRLFTSSGLFGARSESEYASWGYYCANLEKVDVSDSLEYISIGYVDPENIPQVTFYLKRLPAHVYQDGQDTGKTSNERAQAIGLSGVRYCYTNTGESLPLEQILFMKREFSVFSDNGKENKGLYAGWSGFAEAIPLPLNTTDSFYPNWSSANEKVAIVENGIVHAVNAGTTTITASLNGKTASFPLQVRGISIVSASNGVTADNLAGNVDISKDKLNESNNISLVLDASRLDPNVWSKWTSLSNTFEAYLNKKIDWATGYGIRANLADGTNAYMVQPIEGKTIRLWFPIDESTDPVWCHLMHVSSDAVFSEIAFQYEQINGVDGIRFETDSFGEFVLLEETPNISIRFVANGGKGTMSPQAIHANAVTVLNENTFTRDNYVFIGWNTKADGTGIAYADKASVTLTSNLTLYAQWKGTIVISAIKATPTTTNVGDTITWTVGASGGNGTLQYCFYVLKDGTAIKKVAYSMANTLSYRPSSAGSYSVRVYVKDDAGTSAKLEGGAVLVKTGLEITAINANYTDISVGNTVTWTATAKGGSGTLQYCFYVLKDGTAIKKGSYSTANTFSYKPTSAGNYTVRVYVKDGAGSSTKQEGGAVSVSSSTPGALTVSSIMPNKTTANVGETVTWTATASGGSGSIQYCFYVYKNGTTVQKGSYGTGNSYSYKIAANGTYTVKAFAKDASGATANLTGGTVTAGSPAVLTVSAIKANKTTANVGDSITWTATASGGSGTIQYCFYVYKNGATVQKGSYGTANTYTYKATAAGTYTVKAFVKDGAGATANLTGGFVTVASSSPLTVSSVKANKTSANVGDTITWTATASGGSGTLQYCFYVYKNGTTIHKGTYGTANTFSYKATGAGNYTVKAFVKDGAGAMANLTGGAVTVGSSSPLTVTSVKANVTSAKVGDTIIWTATASGGNGSLKYCFYVYRNGTTVQKGSYGAGNAYSYKPTTAGDYLVKAFIKDASGTIVNLVSAKVTVS